MNQSTLGAGLCSASSASDQYQAGQSHLTNEIAQTRGFLSALRAAKESEAAQFARNSRASQTFAENLHSLPPDQLASPTASTKKTGTQNVMVVGIGPSGVTTTTASVPMLASGEPDPAVLMGVAISPHSPLQLTEASAPIPQLLSFSEKRECSDPWPHTFRLGYGYNFEKSPLPLFAEALPPTCKRTSTLGRRKRGDRW